MADIATLSVLLRADDQLSAKLRGVQDRMRDFGRNVGEMGRGLVVLAGPLTAIGGLSIKAAADFESSFAGVRKTVDATEEQFAELSAGFRQMALQIPVNVNELNRIGEAAGQLGIKVENIESFTKTMAALGVTTNLSSDQAATALARLANITRLPQEQVDRLGSTIVELGNNLATTEAEIVEFGLRIAGTGKLAGLTEAQILAIGGAMSSVGVQAEAGGTAVQKVLMDMTAQVASGGAQLELFAATAGMSAEEFARVFREDAGAAFTAFVEGLGTAGEDAFVILEQLGLQDQRLLRSFLSLAGAGDLLRNSIEMGTTAFAENTALTTEAEKRYATFESQMILLKSSLNDVAITIGLALIPPLLKLIEAVRPIIANFGQWAKDNTILVQALVITATAVAALGTALIALGLIMPGITALAVPLAATFALLSGPVGIGALIVALVALGAILFANNSRLWEQSQAMREATAATADLTKVTETLAEQEARLRGEWKDALTLGEELNTRLIAMERPTINLIKRGEALADTFGISLSDAIRRIATEELAKLDAELRAAAAGMDNLRVSTQNVVLDFAALNQAVEEAGAQFVQTANPLEEMWRLMEQLNLVTPTAFEDFTERASDLADRLGIDLATAMRMIAEQAIPALQNKVNDVVQTFVILGDTAEETEAKIVAAIQAETEAIEANLQRVRDAEEERLRLLEDRARREAELKEQAFAASTALINRRAIMEEAAQRMGEHVVSGRQFVMAAQEMLRERGLNLETMDIIGMAGFRGPNEQVTRSLADMMMAALLSPANLQRFYERAGIRTGLEGTGLPSFAAGGIVRQPTFALVGERGPEAIVPLNGRGGAGLTVNVSINGPVYGITDLEQQVAQIWRDTAMAGGFRGLI